MKILYLSNQRLPTEKAYGIQIAKMCEAFADLGHEVELFAPTRCSHIKEDFFDYYNTRRNFKIRRIQALDFYLPGKFDRLAFEIKMFLSALILAWCAWRGRYDLIYSRDEWPLWFLSFCNQNLCFEAHKFSKFKKFIYRRFKNNKLVVIAQGLRQEFEKISFKHILVAPDGVDAKEFALNISQEEARKKVGLPLDKKIIMYTGHLYDWKGAGVLLETARQVLSSELLFVFVGGTDDDVKKFRAVARGLTNVLILGHKPHCEIPLYLKAADILVLPNKKGDSVSENYTSPLKLFEYMVSGRPIVASDLPSLREILNEGNAVLVEPNSSRALAEGIKQIFADNFGAESLAQRALMEAERYGWIERAKKIIEFAVYEK